LSPWPSSNPARPEQAIPRVAYIKKLRNGKHRAQAQIVCHPRESQTFDSRVAARCSAEDREEALRSDTAYESHTMRDAFDKYKLEVTVHKKTSKSEAYRIDAIERQLGERAEWRDALLKEVSRPECTMPTIRSPRT